MGGGYPDDLLRLHLQSVAASTLLDLGKSIHSGGQSLGMLANYRQTSSSALCCTIFTLTPSFVTPQFRKWRASFYAGFGLSSIIFVVHGLVIHGWELQKSRMSLVWMGWMATANLVGACIYAMRVNPLIYTRQLPANSERFPKDGFPTRLIILAQVTSFFTWRS